MDNIKIFPIFNQSAPGVWHSFLRIQSAAMRHVYNYKMTSLDLDIARQFLEQDWRRISYNFAFAATDGTDMVGFIQGNCKRNIATIQNLYVMPECMSQHVGSRLLRCAECGGAINAATIELISLANAQGFYTHNGYNRIADGHNGFTKKISQKPRCTAVPVFYPTPKVVQACRQIAACNGQDFNSGTIKKKRLPLFVYMNVKSDIIGFSVAGDETNDGMPQVCVNAPRQMADIIQKRLVRELGHSR